MSIINVSNLTFGYDGAVDMVFENVSLQLDTAWRLGFVGRNGRGKTTFLQLLTGKHEYSGSISHSVTFEYYPFEVGDRQRSALEVAQSVAPDCPHWQLVRELNLLQMREDCLYQQFDTLSNGEQGKLLLAALFLLPERFLLIDEPTSHLDAVGRQAVSEYLLSKRGFIVVSHDRAFLDGCVDHVLSINRASIEVQRGNFSSWLENKQNQDAFELAANRKLQGEIERLRSSSIRSAEWAQKGHRQSTESPESRAIGFKEFHRKKAGKLASRASSLQRAADRAIAEKSELLKNIERADALALSPLRHRAEVLLECRDVWLGYDGRVVASGINLRLEQGERVAVVGGNGSGKSTLLRAVCGEGGFESGGTISMPSQLVISRVWQDASLMSGSVRQLAEDRGVDMTLLHTLLAKLDFGKAQFDKDIRDFSDGQKKKLMLAASLCVPAHLYVWDEPLNYIDIYSRMQIEQLLLQFCPTMLMVEHDRVFVERIATRTIRL